MNKNKTNNDHKHPAGSNTCGVFVKEAILGYLVFRAMVDCDNKFAKYGGFKMGRRPRVQSETGIYHVILKGLDGRSLFYDEED